MVQESIFPYLLHKKFEIVSSIRRQRLNPINLLVRQINFLSFEPCSKGLSMILNFKFLSYLDLQVKFGKKVVQKSLNYLQNFHKLQRLNMGKLIRDTYTNQIEVNPVS